MNPQQINAASLKQSLVDGLVALAEIGGNKLLGFDPKTLDACKELQGHCIAIEITDLEFCLYCHPGNWGLRLSSEKPATGVDATISGRAMALFNLASASDKISSSIKGGVSFNGNVALAQRLQDILAKVDVDSEEILSQYTGDILAVQIHQGLAKLGGYLQQSGKSILQTSSEYLREEVHLSPTEVEFDEFQSQVDDIKMAVERGEARLNHLADRILLANKKHKK